MPWQSLPNEPVLVKKRPADSALAISPPARLPFDPLAGPPAQAGQIGVIPQAREDPAMCEQSATRHHHDSVAADAKPLSVGHQGMDEIASLVETYLVAERHLVAAVELAGGAVALPDGRTITVGRAEFDALLGERRKRAWVVIRKQAPMPSRR